MEPTRFLWAPFLASALLFAWPAIAGPIWGGAVFMAPPQLTAATTSKGQCYAGCYAKARPCTGRAECSAKAPGCYENCDKAQAAPLPPKKTRLPARVAILDLAPRFM